MKIGIIGAGQLGRMLALAGYPLGSRFRFLDRSQDAPGAQVGDIVLGSFDDAERLDELADSVDLMTFDVENVPAALLTEIASRRPFLPPVPALQTAQDRLSEKSLFAELGIRTPRWRAVDSLDSLKSATADIGYPSVLKTCRLGYDGRGQVALRSPADLAPAWERFAGVALVLEQFISFEYEVSIIGARSTTGETCFYPLTRNTHENGILRHSLAPCVEPGLQSYAEDCLQKIFDRYDYAGILTIEFFVVDRELVANEIAPRVHNSGHWTIEGAVTSQFENHIRAIRGLPLGDTSARGYTAMVNLLGRLPPLEPVLAIRGAHFHDYGKTPRPLRKVGHCTITADTPRDRDAGLAKLLSLID